VTRDTVRSREFPVAVPGIAALAALAWLDVLRRAAAMPGMDMAMPMSAPLSWQLPDLWAAGIMWTTMMIAMMLPSAIPMLLLFSATRRPSAVWLFAAGFLACWAAWSWLAAGLQWILQGVVALSPQLTVVRAPLAAAILIAAGLYQFTPLKHRCLSTCQSPLGFLMTGWRGGRRGALEMGLRYGAYCVGCCWALMALLFVVGVMNLVWIAILAIFVLLEKTAVRGPWLGRVTGTALIGWALYLLSAGTPA
jgi:predicted metal-binding membrane protein